MMMKSIINDLTPPFFKKAYKRFFKKTTYSPEWVMLDKGTYMFMDVNTELYKAFNAGLDLFIYNNLEEELTTENLIVYDLGAHFGYHTLKFAKENKVKKVYAFEPNPDNRERLIMNINRNSYLKEKVSIVEKAISSKKGTSVFLAFNDIEQGVSSASMLQQEKLIAKRKDTLARKIVVSIDTLDNLVSEGLLLPPDIIKIDIEGAEYDALDGSRELLRKNKPVLMIEVHTILNMYQLAGLFNEINYQYKLINTEKDGRIFIKAYAK